MTVRVVTAAQAAARDSAAIAAGVASRSLMRRAGEAAAHVILDHLGERAARGVAVYAGSGNNGGDAWVVAGHLAGRGIPVRVRQVGDPRTDDARDARENARHAVSGDPPDGSEGVVIDGLLGTGARGEPAGEIAVVVDEIGAARSRGAAVVALDLPTGLDATSGMFGRAVAADLTITFGTIKRGHLVARGRCGAIVVVDIGLGPFADLEDGAPTLVDHAWVSSRIPAIEAESHKGVRRRVAIIGGARGMAGAAVLAARAAMRSGVGMVRAIVETPSLAAVQSAAVEATASTWPMSDAEIETQVSEYAHAVLVGPGLGRGADARHLLLRVLEIWKGPVVLDADALNLFASDLDRLAALLSGRPALLTPHLNEMARLVGQSPDEVLSQRFEAGRDLAERLGATVLLKGVPTVITSRSGECLVSAAGTPVLAAAGSGDVLGGIAVTLLAQNRDATTTAAIAAWAHGKAAEIANAGRRVRGVILDDVLAALGAVWSLRVPPPEPPVLAELPRVGDPA
ncbi:MAG TPA: NAD(P)H-hydrate dehydratase [Gemmatimonadaceae bacterium]|nr:NAD(P)H-hydrate dehydratase [Gemmatimonadaceae bacterium]